MSMVNRGVAIMAAMILVAQTPAWGACQCGPDFCQDDPRVPGALAEKKQALAQEYPSRLVALLDIGDQCFARITRSPDMFTIWLVDVEDAKQTVSWSQDNEDLARAQLESGELKRFWIYNAKRAFSCCNQIPYNERDDYNEEDDVSSATAIRCELDEGSKASCSR